MDDGTAVLPGLEDGFIVLLIERIDPGRVKAIIDVTPAGGSTPWVRVLTSRIKDRPVIPVKDLRVSGQVVDLRWRKRRPVCQASLCPRKTFTQQSCEIPVRARLTCRLRAELARANRTVQPSGVRSRRRA